MSPLISTQKLAEMLGTSGVHVLDATAFCREKPLTRSKVLPQRIFPVAGILISNCFLTQKVRCRIQLPPPRGLATCLAGWV